MGWIAAGALAVGCHAGTAASPGHTPAGAEAVVSTEAPPAGSSGAVTKPRTDDLDKPEAAEPISEPPPKEVKFEPIEVEEPEEGGVEGGVIGGVPGGVIGGVPGGVIGGVPGGMVGGVPGGMVGGVLGGVPSSGGPPPATSILNVGDPSLKQTTCPPVGTPPYPQAARDAKVESTLIARCVVETSGSLTCKMIKSHEMLEKTVLAHLAKARVKPFTTMNDVPVRVACNYVFRYKPN